MAVMMLGTPVEYVVMRCCAAGFFSVPPCVLH